MNIKKLFNVSKEVKLIMLATLITNIGNGMYTIAISKLVYDKTNSAMAFGGVMIVQYIIMFLVQFLSGSVVDRNNPKFVSVICDMVNGFLTLSSGIVVLFTNIGLIYLFIAVILLNIISPFFTAANFSLLPAIVKDKSKLLEVNSMITTLFQAGQLLGCALVAPIIYFFSPSTALVIDGITFFLSAIFISLVKINDVVVKKDTNMNAAVNLINDWKEIARIMKKEKSFAAHLFIASGDYISINLFNLMLVPMVTRWYNNNSFCISLYDGGFAVGAMIFVTFVVPLSKKIGTSNSAFSGLLVQTILFLLLILSRQPFITVFITLAFGAVNSFSVAVFTSNLQQRSTGPIKGRVSSAKSFIVSCFSIVMIPIISKLHDISIAYGLTASAAIIFIYTVFSFIFGRKFAFGEEYLTKSVGTETILKYDKAN